MKKTLNFLQGKNLASAKMSPREEEGLFVTEQHFFKWIPAQENCKNQETNRIKSKKINRTLKLCTLATNNLILVLS